MLAFVDFAVSFHETKVKFAIQDAMDLILKYFVAGSCSQTFTVKNFSYFFQAVRAGYVQIIDALNIRSTLGIYDDFLCGFIIQITKWSMVWPFSTFKFSPVASFDVNAQITDVLTSHSLLDAHEENIVRWQEIFLKSSDALDFSIL